MSICMRKRSWFFIMSEIYQRCARQPGQAFVAEVATLNTDPNFITKALNGNSNNTITNQLSSQQPRPRQSMIPLSLLVFHSHKNERFRFPIFKTSAHHQKSSLCNYLDARLLAYSVVGLSPRRMNRGKSFCTNGGLDKILLALEGLTATTVHFTGSLNGYNCI